jgi:hypothetical protein
MKHLLVKAETNSEWDDVSFFQIELDEKLLTLLKKGFDEARRLRAVYDMDFNSLNFSCSGTFYIDENEELFPDEDEERLMLVDDFEEENYKEPENSIKMTSMRIGAFDSVIFSGFGKHTGEEFYTEGVHMDVFFKEEAVKEEKPAIFEISGYWKNDEEIFSGYLVTDNFRRAKKDDIFYCMTEEEIKQNMNEGKENTYEFVITSYNDVTEVYS